MRRGLPLLVLLIALLPASSAPSGTSLPTITGFTEDATKYGDFKLFNDMNDLGVQEDRWLVTWDEAQPATIIDQAFMDQALPVAISHHITVVMSIAPLHAAAIGGNASAQAAFCSYVKLVAQRYYPRVVDFIVGNEANRQRFWQPQWNGTTYVAAQDYEHTLALCYDQLKSVSPDINVIGLALGPNGNDDPQAVSNLSRSPVRFIHDFALTYAQSGRTTPVMDEFAYHPYPAIQDTDPPEKGYLNWPSAGVPNLDRLKQAMWDGFHSTNQPIFADDASGLLTDAPSPPKPLPHTAKTVAPTTAPMTLKFKIDEIGWQTTILDQYTSLYHGTENIHPVDPVVQALDYVKMLRYYFCDSLVKEVLIFPMIDETDLGRWQSGVEWANHDHKPSYDSMKQAIADTQRSCRQDPVLWRHTENVLNVVPTWKPYPAASFSITASEDYSWTATLTDVRTKKVLKTASGRGKAYYNTLVDLRSVLQRGHRYAYTVTMTADMNNERTSVLTRTFAK